MNNFIIAGLIQLLKGDESNRQFAKKAGVKEMQLHRWMNGTKISLIDFEKLCIASGRTLGEVFKFVKDAEGTLKYNYDVPEEYAIQIHNLIEAVMRLEEINRGVPGDLILHITEHVKKLSEVIEAQNGKGENECKTICMNMGFYFMKGKTT